jgi:hypothetical protein
MYFVDHLLFVGEIQGLAAPLLKTFPGALTELARVGQGIGQGNAGYLSGRDGVKMNGALLSRKARTASRPLKDGIGGGNFCMKLFRGNV